MPDDFEPMPYSADDAIADIPIGMYYMPNFDDEIQNYADKHGV